MPDFLKWLFLSILVAAILGLGGYGYVQLDNAAKQRDTSYNYQPAARPTLPVSTRGQPQPQPYQPSCQNPQQREDADLCAQWAAVQQVAEANRLSSTNIRLGIFLAVLTMIGTAALVVTFGLQRLTSRREQRAYLRVIGQSIPPVANLTDGRVTFAVENYGKTPALNVLQSGVFFFAPFPLPDDHSIEKEWETKGSGCVVHPGIRPDFGIGIKMTQADANAASGPNEAVRQLYVAARIDYKDVFGKEHREQYCARIHYDAGAGPRFGMANRHQQST